MEFLYYNQLIGKKWQSIGNISSQNLLVYYVIINFIEIKKQLIAASSEFKTLSNTTHFELFGLTSGNISTSFFNKKETLT